MDNIRLATTEEVEQLKNKSDLQFAQAVYAMGNARAVLRMAPELDPVDYADLPNNGKRAFISYLEAHLRLSGLGAYYFNVPATEEMAKYREVVENWGAVKTGSDGPEFRYKKTL